MLSTRTARAVPSRASTAGGLGLLALIGLAGCSSADDPAPAIEPPEAVILISIDTLRADYLGLHGYEEYDTSPFLDTFAEESFVFENSIVVEPFTLTSHMSLFTGLYPQRHKVGRESSLPEGIETLASLMKRAGYATQAFADGGWMRDLWGIERGFDEYESPDRRGFETILVEARDWLEAHGSEKFFLFLHTYDVHNWGMVPFYKVSDEVRGMYSNEIDSIFNGATKRQFEFRFERREGPLHKRDEHFIRASYAEGIRYVDGLLKEFFDYLKEAGIYERALIVVWSDHGEGLFDHEDWGHQELFEHTIRSPLLVRVPGLPGNGKRIETVVSGVDLTPTILDLTGVPIPDGLDGESIVSHFFDEPSGGEAFSIQPKTNHFSIRTPGYHLIWNADEDTYQFFDLEEDPDERNDLWPSDSAEAKRLQARLKDWVEAYEAELRREADAEATAIDSEAEDELRALGYVE